MCKAFDGSKGLKHFLHFYAFQIILIDTQFFLKNFVIATCETRVSKASNMQARTSKPEGRKQPRMGVQSMTQQSNSDFRSDEIICFSQRDIVKSSSCLALDKEWIEFEAFEAKINE